MIFDLATLLPAMTALLGVLALVLIAERLARFSGFAGRRVGRGERLAVEEALPLDGRRRLAVVRCGAARVLLLTGGPQDVVVGWLPATGADAAALGREELLGPSPVREGPTT